MKRNDILQTLYFLSGILMYAFANGRFFQPLWTWLFPILLLNFSRQKKPAQGYLFLAIGLAVANQFAFHRFVSDDPRKVLFYLPAMLGPVIALPYLCDALLWRRLRGFSTTLVFPASYVLVEFLYSQNPLGGTGVLGYTQYQWLSLVQWASLAGVLGLTFLLTWTGSVLVWLSWAYHQNRSLVRPVFIFCFVWLIILGYGSVRLQMPMPASTVRVTGLHVYDLRGPEGQRIMRTGREDPQALQKEGQDIITRLFAATRKEAAAGARIIVWSEISPPLFHAQRDEWARQAGELAREENIYLATAPYIFHDDELNENQFMLFSPDGESILTHDKYGGNILEGSQPGDGNIAWVDSRYGRLAGVICWDQDFPRIVRQVGQKDVDILLAPNADWREITPLHSAVGYFRAVENGVSLVRQNVNGLSLITDPKGRILAQMDHFQSDQWVMTASVPIRGVQTLYAWTGDWIAAFAAIILFIQTIRYQKEKRRRKNDAS